MTPAEFARFERFVEPEPNSGCWLWSGAMTSSRGYGKLSIGGRTGREVCAHRLAYEHFKGPIPAEYEVDHLCRVRPCVNPAHLEATTRLVNRRRQCGVSDNGAHCKRGHSDWYVWGKERQYRRCRRCRTICSVEWNRKHRGN